MGSSRFKMIKPRHIIGLSGFGVAGFGCQHWLSKRSVELASLKTDLKLVKSRLEHVYTQKDDNKFTKSVKDEYTKLKVEQQRLSQQIKELNNPGVYCQKMFFRFLDGAFESAKLCGRLFK